MHSTTKLIVRSALFLALAVILPIVFHQFGLAGRVFNPMHIPVLLAGFICGPVGGVIVGLLSPAISFMITGMPPSYAVPLMSLELPIYGLIAGLTYVRLKLNIYIALILAIIFGRLAFALGLLILGFFIELPYGLETYFKVVLATGLLGTLVQLVIIPPITAALMRRRKL